MIPGSVSQGQPPYDRGMGHRYWRLFIVQNAGDGSNTGLSELILLDDVNGTDLTKVYGGTASASGSSNGSEVAANAFDRVTTTQWAIGGTTNKWIAWDFGAGNERMVRAFTIRGINNFPAMSPASARLEWSDDNASWTPAYTIPFLLRPWVAGQSRFFATPDSTMTSPARYWRVIGRSQTDGSISTAEIELRASIGGADETGTGTATARVSGSGEGPERAFDNNAATNWTSGTSYQFGEWIQYDFGAGNEKTIVEMSYKARATGTVTESIKSGALQFSIDGITWKDAFVIAAAPWTTFGQVQIFSKP